MKQYGISLTCTLLSIGYVYAMDHEQPSLMTQPQEILCKIVAQSIGSAKNALRLTCKALHAIASFVHRDALIKNPSIHLCPLEKQLLLFEYVAQNNAEMIKHLFDLGATHDLDIFDPQLDLPFPHSGSCLQNSISRSFYQKFPQNRNPCAATSECKTLLHISADNRYAAIIKIILDYLNSILERIDKEAVSLNSEVPLPLEKLEYNAQNRIQKTNIIRNFISQEDINGMTVFHIAANNNDQATVNVLVNHKISTSYCNKKNSKGLTPLTIAQEKKHITIEALLLKTPNAQK